MTVLVSLEVLDLAVYRAWVTPSIFSGFGALSVNNRDPSSPIPRSETSSRKRNGFLLWIFCMLNTSTQSPKSLETSLALRVGIRSRGNTRLLSACRPEDETSSSIRSPPKPAQRRIDVVGSLIVWNSLLAASLRNSFSGTRAIVVSGKFYGNPPPSNLAGQCLEPREPGAMGIVTRTRQHAA